MKKQNKLTYETPTLTVVEFRVERGFADSGDRNFVINTHQKIDDFIENSLGDHMVIGQTDIGKSGIVAGGMTGNEDHSGDGSSSGWQYSNGGWF